MYDVIEIKNHPGVHVQMGLPMLIKQRLAPACMHAYADVISLGGDLRYPKALRYIVTYDGT